jgi:MobA/MobL family
MAIYHLAAQEFSRGRGDSVVHAAAYRARADLTDERTGLRHDYSRKAGELLFEGIYAPKDAPEWAHDRAQLWNHVEAFEKHRRAILAREFVIALPHELTLEQSRRAVQDWVRDNFTRKGLIADVTIHATSATCTRISWS